MRKTWHYLVEYIIPPSCILRICNPIIINVNLKFYICNVIIHEKYGYQKKHNLKSLFYKFSNIADSSYRYAAGESQAARIKIQNYGYDANGNLVYINTGLKNADNTFTKNNERKLLWDEENRQLALSDNGFVSNYYTMLQVTVLLKQAG